MMHSRFNFFWRRAGRRWLVPLFAGFFIAFVLLLSNEQITSGGSRRSEDSALDDFNAKGPSTKDGRSPSADGAANSGNAKSESAKSAVEKFIESESNRVGQTDKDPDASFKRLKKVAKNLRKRDFDALLAIALNSKLNTDQRFLSAYLLALSDNPAASQPLMKIATSPVPSGQPSSPQYAEELVVRTQALEGLAKFHKPGRPVLAEFLAKQDHAFLAQQARRLLHERKKKR